MWVGNVFTAKSSGLPTLSQALDYFSSSVSHVCMFWYNYWKISLQWTVKQLRIVHKLSAKPQDTEIYQSKVTISSQN